MKALVALEHHFRRDVNGAVIAEGPPAYSFWELYLENFEEVLVLARVSKQGVKASGQMTADGPGVTFFPLVDYRGPSGYLRSYATLREQICRAVHSCDAYILRVPGLIGRLAAAEIRRLNRPYAVEVVGDPWRALAPGTWPSPFTPIYRRILTRNLRRLCSHAAAVRYVTREVLPVSYPAGPGAFTTVFSDVELGAALISAEEFKLRLHRIAARKPGPAEPFRLGFVGSLAQRYKGADILLQAVARLRAEGFNVEADFAGDGALRPALEAMARELGIANHARFLGYLPYGRGVYDFLDTLDLFVMPSRTEGLPRAILEAMARGCPCIGSDVGGIPELLEPECRFHSDDTYALVDKIKEVCNDSSRRVKMAQGNYLRAKDYSPEILAEYRRAFYQFIRKNLLGTDQNRGFR
jgi:glycosyltransferase involved in cell wall biosynthesis